VSEDVLVKWSLFITESASRSKYVFDECVGDLAAEVRAQREQIKAYVVCNEANLAENAVLRARVAELEKEKRLAWEWECADCGRINPGTMPYCPCREGLL